MNTPRTLFALAVVWALVLPCAIMGQDVSGCSGTFDGKWRSTWGELTIRLAAGQATGEYGKNKTIRGTVSGGVLTGKWFAGKGEGPIRFVLSPDGRRFEGTWSEKGRQPRKWTGTCIAALNEYEPPTSPVVVTKGCTGTFTGLWDTRFGDMSIRIDGDLVYGSYGDGKTVAGRVRDDVLEGQWFHGTKHQGAPSLHAGAGRRVLHRHVVRERTRTGCLERHLQGTHAESNRR